MNRTIKFRAWDTDHKIIVYPDQMRNNINLGLKCLSCFNPINGFEYYPKPSQIIIMQFTGLYDCEGKEIYENDIVQITNKTETFIESIIYLHDRFRVTNQNGYVDNLFMFVNTGKLKVIGNLFEHSHLLNNES